MAGLSLDRPLPVIPEYDPARATWRADGQVKFETGAMATSEVAERWRLTKETIDKHPHCIDVDAALDLAIKLERDPRDRTPAQTLASSEYYRDIRRGLVSQTWHLLARSGLRNPSVGTLRPDDTFVRAADLTGGRVGQIGHQFKEEFRRNGIIRADGMLVTGLHAEFDVYREGYDFHAHLAGAGEKIQALENLRGLDRYQWEYGGVLPDGRKQSARVIVSKLKPEHYPDRLTYVCQSYVPHSPTGKFGGGDKVTRSHRAGRIPEPFHTEWLLLMDSLRVSDLIFTSGLKLTRAGLELA